MKFTNELYHNLTRKHAWEAVFRIRLSTGFKQTSTYGNVTIKAKTADLILCPTIDLYYYCFSFKSFRDRTIIYELEKNDIGPEDPIKASRRDPQHLYC